MMYMKRMIEIGKAENGYVVECRVPFKPKKDNENGLMECSTEKQYIAETIPDVAKIIEKIMPLLDEDFSSEDEFDNAFGKAAKS